MPFFSVIIPLYNKEHFIENTIKSLLNQTFTDFEILIINDGSTDSSEACILKQTDSRIRYFSKENGGASTARNFGIDRALGQFISFLDADDFWYPNVLDTFYTAIHDNPEAKVFGARIEIELADKKIYPAVYSFDTTPKYQLLDYFKNSLKESALTTISSTFHKSVFEKIGNFDTNIRSGQDTDLWIRIGLEYPILFCNTLVARYCYDPKSLSKNSNFYANKLNFSKFKEFEKENPTLKKFLDYNRLSFGIRLKLSHREKEAKILFKDINLNNIPHSRWVLLYLPASILKLLLNVKFILNKLGIVKTVFK
ncbi:glycosyltransferase family 2 protein [Flavobacterium sp.]|uniref:glycosyltransferase family 2 protein n=1 Tax=Flavobacterium sp. TaxID=239 RepID=UPI003D0BB99B